MRKSGIVNITTTFTGAEKSLGTVEGILEAANTKLFADDIARIFYSNMSREFDLVASLAARANPDKYSHMYDWNMLGFKSGKLWKTHMVGGIGARRITFSFKPSKNFVPKTTPQNTGISGSDFPNLRKNGRYMFPNKAAVFELGITTNILPVENDRVFVPLKHKTRSGWKESNFGGKLSPRDIKRGFVWAKGTTQEHHETAGNFSTLFLTFFEESADRVFNEKVEPRINNRIRKVYKENMPNLGGSTNVSKTTRGTSNRISIGAIGYAKRHASTQLKREMRQAVKEATLYEDDEYDDF